MWIKDYCFKVLKEILGRAEPGEASKKGLHVGLYTNGVVEDDFSDADEDSGNKVVTTSQFSKCFLPNGPT